MPARLRLTSSEEVVQAGDMEVGVAYASLDQSVAVQERLIASCSAAERDRAARQVRSWVARERLVARGLLRAVLADRLGVRSADVALDQTSSGKPCMAGTDPAMRFSLSHSAGIVAICLHERLEVGIDVEHRGRRLDIDVLVRTVVSPAQAAPMLTPGPGRQDAFLRWWTRREALGKGGGRGLDWHTANGAGAWLAPAPVDGAWVVCDVDAPPGFVAAVAAQERRDPAEADSRGDVSPAAPPQS